MEIKLDPELQAVVDEAAAANPNPPHASEVPLDMLRAGYVMISELQGLKDVACHSIEDIEIPCGTANIAARVYKPAGAPETESLPGMIFIHGGGFMIGNLDSHDSVCRQLANGAGCAVIALDYRLAPEHKFPAAVDDVLAASSWIFDHAGHLGLDPYRMAIGGDSAGGNLSAVVCNQFASNDGPKFLLQLLIYPATNRTVETPSLRDLKEGVTLDARILEYFNDGYFGGTACDPSDPRISPALAADHTKVAPAHIVTAEYDPLRDEGKAYAEILEKAGVTVSYRCYEGMMHNFIQQTGVVTAARHAVEEMAAVLRDALKG